MEQKTTTGAVVPGRYETLPTETKSAVGTIYQGDLTDETYCLEQVLSETRALCHYERICCRVVWPWFSDRGRSPG